MREIIFRGKWINNGEWIEGYFGESRKKDICYIIKRAGGDSCSEYFIDFEVSPETVGQFTGLTDKHGKRIFEGDIVFDTIDQENDLIIFERGSFIIKNNHTLLRLGRTSSKQIEVIGNIYDNPELINV